MTVCLKANCFSKIIQELTILCSSKLNVFVNLSLAHSREHFKLTISKSNKALRYPCTTIFYKFNTLPSA